MILDALSEIFHLAYFCVLVVTYNPLPQGHIKYRIFILEGF